MQGEGYILEGSAKPKGEKSREKRTRGENLLQLRTTLGSWKKKKGMEEADRAQRGLQ